MAGGGRSRGRDDLPANFNTRVAQKSPSTARGANSRRKSKSSDASRERVRHAVLLSPCGAGAASVNTSIQPIRVSSDSTVDLQYHETNTTKPSFLLEL